MFGGWGLVAFSLTETEKAREQMEQRIERADRRALASLRITNPWKAKKIADAQRRSGRGG